jgi:Outer membrane protein beta-barrel domain
MEMNPVFTVQPEVMVIQKGSRKEVGDWMTYEVTTKLTCVDAAVISKIHPLRLGGVRPSLIFGPYASMLVSGTYDYGSSTETIDDYNKIEAGMIIGAAVDLTLGKSRVVFDLRYNIGWTDAHKVPSTIWNRGLLLGAGIVF